MELGQRARAAPDRSAEFRATKEQAASEFRDVGADLDYLAAIRAALPADGFFVEEICQAGFASYFGFPVHAPRQFVTCGYQGTLGFGYPTSLGVKAAFPERAVVSIAGDGGFMFGIAELATAVQHDLGVVAVVFNNNAFGNVLLDQQRLLRGPGGGRAAAQPRFRRRRRGVRRGWLQRPHPGGTGGHADQGSRGWPASGDRSEDHDRRGSGNAWKYLMPGRK